ncbi:MAG: LacI family DNA-binding transcriptional regulator [Paracoccaceae bacterium]
MANDVNKVSAITSFDVARVAGVSRSAVSRAFTPGTSISSDTRMRVLKAASDLGYRVNLVARGLNKQRTDLVGMIVAGLTTTYRSEQIDALAKQLVREGFRPMLFCIDDGKDAGHLLSILLNYQVSGVVITSDAPPVEICAECTRMQVPLALVHRADELPFVDRINGDNVKGGRLAAETLIKAGRKHLIAIKHSAISYSEVTRTTAFEDRAAELGVATEIIEVHANEYSGGAAAAGEVVARLSKRPGVFCTTDSIALGLLDTLRHKLGIKVPQELSLIGYDDIPQASWAFAELTTIKQSVEDFAQVTVNMLKERIKNPDAAARNEIVDVKLIMRGTV